MVDDSFFAEIQEAFLHDATDLLRRVEGLSLELERSPDSAAVYAELARLAHNFKGSGKAVGFDHISSLAHRIEDFILAIQSKKIASGAEQLDFLFQCLDRLKTDVDLLIADRKAELNYDSLMSEFERWLSGDAHTQSTASSQSPKNSQEGAAPAEPLSMETSGSSRAQEQNPSQPQPQAVATASSQTKSSAPKAEVLRIPKSKIDFLLESFGEQVILQSTLEQYKFDLNANRDLILKTISQLTKLTFELQSHALSLTMVQIAPTFVKLERAIRDAARICEKQVSVIVEGGETEVDKTLIESLSDSLTHMVRNSVDHAIEGPEERLKNGKVAHGTVSIRARRTGGQLWIEVQDDGKGLNADVIKEKALRKGLIGESEIQKLSKDDIYRLIFLNGFSTKETVSEVSGRGVGMNVVLEAVTNLSGVIDIESEPGKGTLFRLKLPLTLAIFNGAVVRVNKSRFIVPTSDIAEINRLALNQSVQLDRERHAVRIRDEVFELIDLRARLASTRAHSGLAQVQRTTDLPLLISRKGKTAFLVDEILGMQKIVQKPLGEEVKLRPEFAAGTILSDGSPSVILNLNFFAQSA